MLPPKATPTSKLVSVELHIDGGYVCRGTVDFDIPSGSEVELFLVNAPDSFNKSGWFFNNDEVLETRVNDNGKSAKIKALRPGSSIGILEGLGIRVKINVIGKEAVGFKATEVSSETDI